MKARRGAVSDFRLFTMTLRPESLQVALTALLAASASAFEGASVGLLLPLTTGVFKMDFGSVLIGTPLARLPEWLPEGMRGDRAMFGVLMALVFLSSLARHALHYASILTAARHIRRLIHRLRERIFARYMSFGKLFFDSGNAGQMQHVLLAHTQLIAAHLIFIQSGLTVFVTFFAYLAVLIYISWKLTLLVLVFFPPLQAVIQWLNAKIKKTSIDQNRMQGELGRKVFNVLSCLPLVKATSREDSETVVFSKISSQTAAFEYSIDKKIYLLTPLQETLLLAGTLVFISILAAMISRSQGLTQAEIAKYLVFFYVMRRTMYAFGVLNSMKGYAVAILGPVSEIAFLFKDEGKPFIRNGSGEFTGLEKGIVFHDVGFSYDGRRAVFFGLNFFIEKKRMTAIVGPSGSGKSTLINLLLRFYDPAEGSIRFDGTDAREFKLKSLHAKMALVGQECHLFNDTLRANLVYGIAEEDVSDQKLADAVRRARLEDFIRNLPRGLETPVGDRGIQLSGGEKQRVSIARALLKNAEILILDEATSSLDADTERRIQEAMDELVKDKTTIVIAHRFATIRNADKLIVLQGGSVVEQGTLESLLQKKGFFYEYWQRQTFVP